MQSTRSPFARSRVHLSHYFMRYGKKKEYGTGEVIYWQGDEANAIYCLATGLVKLSATGETGGERILGIYEPGTIFGEASSWEGSTYLSLSTALGDCIVYCLSAEAVFKHIFADRDLTADLISSLAEKVHLCSAHIQETAFIDASSRVIKIVQILSEHYGYQLPHGRKINIHLTHEELGQLCGTSRVTVTKTINKLMRDGILAKEKWNLIVVDEAKLQSLLLVEK